MQRLEFALRSNNSSSGRGSGIVTRNPDQQDFSRKEDSPLMAVPSRIDCNANFDGNDETPVNEIIEYGNFRH